MEQFEAWADEKGFCLDQIFMSTNGVPDNPYENEDTKLAYEIWCASRSPSCSTRRFPMQHGLDIDWTTAEKIYAMYSALYGTSQSLERLAQRGGFDWKEVEIIQAEYNKRVRR
ncbi:hypothetical protein GCM10022414_07400 [Zhongshania borealis]|uniref:Uncharacterized protein n=2 Tax=Zhongshania borealis TaxID=889488 RepID=A0ABP7WE75_9GAMM